VDSKGRFGLNENLSPGTGSSAHLKTGKCDNFGSTFILENKLVKWPLITSIRDRLVELPLSAGLLISGLWSAVVSEPKAYILGLVFITVAASLIRVSLLFGTMRFDEACTFLQFASRPIKVLVSNYHTPNNHVFTAYWRPFFVSAFR
jgi:hypothetical protein